MTASFLAFIDESGDDGLGGNYRVPGRRGGATHWLVISATIVKRSRSQELVAWRDEILDQMPDKKNRNLHFAQLNHGQKLAAVRTLSGKPLRIISVLAAKKPIPAGMYSEKNQLYFYMTRYLVERISWFCRDYRQAVPEGDGTVAITFSRRGGMSYPAFRDYLTRLRENGGGGVRVHWPAIDIPSVTAHDHSRLAGLQIADVGASAMAGMVEPDFYGNYEPRYARTLRPVVYNHDRNYLSYGLKIVPRAEQCGLDEEQAANLAEWEMRQPPGP
ncbi:MAG: DUF3800 domain-containing protein [Oceanicaulis sp.]